MSNVIAVDFRGKGGVLHRAPPRSRSHRQQARQQLTRLLMHRHPDGIPLSKVAAWVMWAIIDHLANLPNGLHHAQAWFVEHLPDTEISLDPLRDHVDNGGRVGLNWSKEDLGDLLGLTAKEARAFLIKTVAPMAKRRQEA